MEPEIEVKNPFFTKIQSILWTLEQFTKSIYGSPLLKFINFSEISQICQITVFIFEYRTD